MVEGVKPYLTLLFALFISTQLIRFIFFRARVRVRLPPSPIALPIIGHLHLLSPFPHQSFYSLSNRYGPLIYLHLGSAPCVIVSSPEIAEEILKTNDLSFASRPPLIAVNYISYGYAGFIFTPYGPYWRFIKKLCMSQLLGGRALDQFFPVRREEIITFLGALLEKSKSGEMVNVGAELMRFTSNMMTRMVMGVRCSEGKGQAAEEVDMLTREVAELVGTFNVSDFIGFLRNFDLQGLGKRIKEAHKRFDGLMESIIKEHQDKRMENKERDGGGDDMLDMLLDISEDKSSDIQLTRENIKAFILDILTAGTDTSAVTIEWALAELINHPAVLQKAREEIDLVIGRNRLVEESDIQHLPYLQAIVKETMRLHPAAPLIPRLATQDCKIGGYDIPKNVRVFINVWSIGRDPRHWEDPLKFCPERFMGSGNYVDVRGQHFHLLPFGSGRRGCPGAPLALHTVQAILAAMLQCFEWKVGGDGEETMVDMTEGVGLTVPMAKPLMCLPIARESIKLI